MTEFERNEVMNRCIICCTRNLDQVISLNVDPGSQYCDRCWEELLIFDRDDEEESPWYAPMPYKDLGL